MGNQEAFALLCESNFSAVLVFSAVADKWLGSQEVKPTSGNVSFRVLGCEVCEIK